MITDTKYYKDLSSVWTEVWRETRDHFDNESDAFKKLFSAVGEFLDNVEECCEYEDDDEQENSWYDENSFDKADYNNDSNWK